MPQLIRFRVNCLSIAHKPGGRLDHTLITARTLAASSKELTLTELVDKCASICRGHAGSFEVGSSDGE